MATMSTYAPLFRDIVGSSVWVESHETLRLWVYLLSQMDAEGYVGGSIVGIAHAALLKKEEAERSMAVLMAPDSGSRTKTDGGRRVVEVERGFRVVNAEEMRRRARMEAKRVQDAARKRRQRAKSESTPDTV